MSWLGPLWLLAMSALVICASGLSSTAAGFSTSDSAQGKVRAGAWATPTPTSTPGAPRFIPMTGIVIAGPASKSAP